LDGQVLLADRSCQRTAPLAGPAAKFALGAARERTPSGGGPLALPRRRRSAAS